MKMKKVNGLRITGIVFALLGFIYMLVSVVLWSVFRFSSLNDEEQKAMQIVSLVFLILAISFLTAALIITVFICRKKNREKKLVAAGNYRYAVVSQIVLNTLVTVKMKHPYDLICTCCDDFTGQTETYVCRNVFRVDESVIGSTVKVYFDPEDKKNYFIDLDSLYR